MHVAISLAQQRLCLHMPDGAVRSYPVSTAARGAGEQRDSECTPRGAHVIAAKIGEGLAVNSVLVGRRATGELYTAELGRRAPRRDWILTRILWLAGTEPGRNLGGDVDTHRRYIYIHGCPDETPMGIPGSRGCIRMHNADLLQLYQAVTVGCPVHIRET